MNFKKIVCVAVHPDDETLGTGGSLLRWRDEGIEIHWLILTKIDKSLGYTSDMISKRNTEIENVQKKYGFKTVAKLDFLTTRLDQYPMSDLVGEIAKIIAAIKPDTLIIPHRFDAHSDHRVAYEALMPFMKSFRYPYIKTILAMETLSETGYSVSDVREAFVPNYFVDIEEDQIREKISIMKLYEGEIKNHPFPRSETGILSQAQLRGAYINSQYAEAFQVIKSIY